MGKKTPPLTDKVQAMIRVNHAGEYGATRIYAGQLAALKDSKDRHLVEEMAAQEATHYKKFNNLLVEHSVNATVFMPLWHVAGFAMGYLTGLMGEKAAHACTIAVEEIIDEHYSSQLRQLHTPQGDAETILKETIETCHADELAHMGTAAQRGGKEITGYSLISHAVKAASRFAIWLSTRV